LMVLLKNVFPTLSLLLSSVLGKHIAVSCLTVLYLNNTQP